MTFALRFTLVASLCAAGSLAGFLAGCKDGASAGESTAAAAQPSELAQDAPAPAVQPPPAQPAAPSQQAAQQTAQLGEPAPDFTLTDLDGTSHTLSALRGKTVVLEWFNPDCPFVKHAHQQGELASMAKQLMGDSLVWLAVNSGAPGKQGHGVARNRKAKDDFAMQNPILLDESGSVGRLYGAEKTPHMYVIDAQGTLVYRGAIDNAPIGKVDPERPRLPTSGQDQLVNYVRAALEDMQAARALRISDTPAYGCTVKYQS